MRAENASTYSNVFTNCSYEGDIKVVGSFAARTTVGGLIGYNSSNYVTLDNCHSSGSITFENQYSAGDMTNYVAVGGIYGYDGQETNFKSLCTSSMNLGVSGNCKTADKPLYVGGIVGSNSRNNNNRYNAMNIKNSGNITIGKVDVTTNESYLCVGGVVGMIVHSKNCTGYENAVNTGNITLIGEISGTTGESYIGGLYGYTEEPIVNAQCYCNIVAPGIANTGMVMGVPRAEATLAKNCKLGGTIAFTSKETEDSMGETQVVPIVETITEENYFNYIYGGTTDWSGVENYDGCEFLSVKPE